METKYDKKIQNINNELEDEWYVKQNKKDDEWDTMRLKIDLKKKRLNELDGTLESYEKDVQSCKELVDKIESCGEKPPAASLFGQESNVTELFDTIMDSWKQKGKEIKEAIEEERNTICKELPIMHEKFLDLGDQYNEITEHIDNLEKEIKKIESFYHRRFGTYVNFFGISKHHKSTCRCSSLAVWCKHRTIETWNRFLTYLCVPEEPFEVPKRWNLPEGVIRNIVRHLVIINNKGEPSVIPVKPLRVFMCSELIPEFDNDGNIKGWVPCHANKDKYGHKIKCACYQKKD